MRWLAAIAVALLATPGLAQGQLDPGFAVMNACSEIWATRSEDELTRIYEAFRAQYDERFGLLVADLDEARTAYEGARGAFIERQQALTKSLIDMADKGGGLVIDNLIREAHAPEDMSALDALVDKAVGAGTTITRAADVAGKFEGSTELVSAQQEAEQAMKDKRRVQLRVQAQIDALAAITDRITACAYDQMDAISAAGAEQEKAAADAAADPDKPAPMDLRPYDRIREAGTGFKEPPSRTLEVAQPGPGPEGFAPPYWPEQCQAICLADTNCLAWNYVHPDWANPMPPAQCQIYAADSPGFTGYSFTKTGYWSGWGPASVKAGYAKAP